MHKPACHFAIGLLALIVSGISAPPSAADFTTVINVPPQPTTDFIDSDTQLNLFASGEVGDGFIAGSFGGTSSNLEVNVFGGLLGDNFGLNASSTLNLYGGATGDFGDAFAGSRVLIAAGVLGDFFDANAGSNVRIQGGSVGEGFDARSGSQVEIVGGTIGDDFNASAGSSVHLLGKQFFLNATEITGSLFPGQPSTVALRGATLSGVLADDTPFSFDLNSDDAPLQDYFDPLADLSLTLLHPADYDRSGVVDPGDYAAWTQQYGSQSPLTADGNADGVIDAADYSVWRDALLADEAAISMAVPSPATLPLCLMVLLIGTTRHGLIGCGECRYLVDGDATSNKS